MIKVFYNGYMIKQNSSQPEEANGYFQLSDNDTKRFEAIGKVTVRSVIGERLNEYDMLIWEEGDDLPLEQYSAVLTDVMGEPYTFKLSKEKTYDERENGDILELIFDEEPQTNAEPPIIPVENNAPTVRHHVEPKEKTSLLNIPKKRKNDWAEVINEMANQFLRKHGKLPTAAQGWDSLCNTPVGYEITTGKDKGGEVCLKMEGFKKSLSKSAFNKRWANYTK